MLADITRHYEHSDLIYLGIVGELPDDAASRLFKLALASFATLSIADAPAHVAVLSRICGGALASAIGAGALVLADRARTLVEDHGSLRTWLEDPRGEPPQQYLTAPMQLRQAQVSESAGGDVAALQFPLQRDAIGIVLLFAAGVKRAEHMEAAIVTASMIGMVAEALCAGPADLASYPVKLPPFHYVDNDDA